MPDNSSRTVAATAASSAPDEKRVRVDARDVAFPLDGGSGSSSSLMRGFSLCFFLVFFCSFFVFFVSFLVRFHCSVPEMQTCFLFVSDLSP